MAQRSSATPQLVDITPKTGITFTHLSSPDKKYIVESMSGGVALIDYDRDSWPDIYFTNAPDVAMSLAGTKARSALYHNNHDGTFTDVTDKAGVGHPCWAMGAVVGDYNNDGLIRRISALNTASPSFSSSTSTTEPSAMSAHLPVPPSRYRRSAAVSLLATFSTTDTWMSLLKISKDIP